MGFGPPKELTDPDEVDKHFAAPIKLAPLQCFHCLGEGHMKPQCPLLKTDGPAQSKQNAPQGRSNECFKRMLQAISGLTAPRQSLNGQRNGQAKAVRTSADEEIPDDNVSVTQESECNIMSEVQEPRQDHLKILKLADKRQLSLLECGGHQVTKELECETNHSIGRLCQLPPQQGSRC